MGAMSVLAGGLAPAGGVTTPGAFPLRGVAGTPDEGVAMLGVTGSDIAPVGAVTAAGGFPPGVATGAPGDAAGAPGVTVGGLPNAGATGAGVGGFPCGAGAPGATEGGGRSGGRGRRLSAGRSGHSRRPSRGVAPRGRGRRRSTRGFRGRPRWRANRRQRFDVATGGAGNPDRDGRGRLHGVHVARQRWRPRRRPPKSRQAGRRYSIAMVVIVMLKRDRADYERNSDCQHRQKANVNRRGRRRQIAPIIVFDVVILW